MLQHKNIFSTIIEDSLPFDSKVEIQGMLYFLLLV
jgi:hypothetical protein